MRPTATNRILGLDLEPVHPFVNVNTAGVEELMRLPGVGVRLAEEIIRHVNIHGPFQEREGLLRVHGINQRKYWDMKCWVATSGPTTLKEKP